MSDQRWRVRRARRKDGSLYGYVVAWDVFNPNGESQGLFDTWDEAMRWATDPTYRIEYYANVMGGRTV